MRTPTELDLQQLLHRAAYDPVYAREYYLRNRKLKGRDRAKKIDPNSWDPRDGPKPKKQRMRTLEDGSQVPVGTKIPSWRDPRTGKTLQEIQRDAKAKQKKELGERVDRLEGKLKKLEAKIAEMIREEKAEDRKSKAKKERAAKEADKPKTAAEKAKDARESEKYRDKNQQKLKNDRDKKAKEEKDKERKRGGGQTVSELKTLATKVRGQVQVAKQKLAALG